MGYVRKVRIGACAALLSAVACVQTTDPASPCPALDVRADEAPVFVTPSTGPVLAMSTPGRGEAVVVYPACDPNGVCVMRIDSIDIPPHLEVLLTSGGEPYRFLVARDDNFNLLSFELRNDGPDGPSSRAPDPPPSRLVASMRNSEIVIVRAGESDAEQELYRYDPSGGEEGLQALASGRSSLKIIAVGERHAVARELVDGANEALYLVPVSPLDESLVGDPIPLVRGPAFSRVVLTPGDERVLATSGEGKNANTLVFDVPDGHLLDRFSGAAISGLFPEAELPGLSAVSPDGSFAVYRTPSGALALRDLELSSSCLVRGAGASDHKVAGFSADGLIYMESTPHRVGPSDVLAHDLRLQRSSILGEAIRSNHLAAVPGRAHELDADTLPWAISVTDGSYWAVQEGGAEALGLDDVMFLPRDAGAAWVLDSSFDRSEGVRHMKVSRVEPRDAENAAPNEAALDFVPQDTHFVQQVPGNSSVCVSSGAPGSWARPCGDADDERFLGGSSLPDSEDPYPPSPEPGDPDEGTDESP